MRTARKEQLLRVGDLARAVGKTVRAMHLYEELGLLKPVSRSTGGYRLYADDAVERVGWIHKLQDMGFALSEIQGFLRDWEDARNGPEGMARVRQIFESKLRETRETIERLEAVERDLKASMSYLETCVTCAPSHAHTDCVCCSQPGHDPLEQPALVAGLARPQSRLIDVPVAHLTEGAR